MYSFVPHPTPEAFLTRAQPWLMRKEDHHNLILSLSYGRAAAREWPDGSLFATVEAQGDVVGCVMRTPPHKVLVTEIPIAAAPSLASALTEVYESIPAVLGPPGIAEAVASEWVRLRGGGWRPGMDQGVYRLDEVTRPEGIAGSMRVARADDVELAAEWGEGFARDTGVAFPAGREAVLRWVKAETLHIWEDEDRPVSIAVAHGRTLNGVRVGYVYTPPEYRKRGYASACVAGLSQKMLDAGFDFCILYTDMANPTSNAIYQRLGYDLLTVVRDYDLISEDEL